jgi:pimeloyl-ACP methyl ester carboxylesterase
MAAITLPKNRTTVRAQRLALRVARTGMRILEPSAPSLAARYAERLFLTARRHRRPAWEVDALADARRDRVVHEGAWIPTWTWRPGSPKRGVVSFADEAPAVILVHGWEGRGSQLASFVPSLLDAGLRVVTFDAPGHGDSPLSRASVVEHARALVSVARAVGPVHAVVGHSVGGAAALLATELGLDAARYAVIAAPIGPSAFAASFARMLGMEGTTKERMFARLERRYGIRMDDLDSRHHASRLDKPLLVVHDKEDSVVPWHAGDAIAAAAKHGRLRTTTGLGHRAILRSPDVIEEVVSFVQEGAPMTSFADTLEGELYFRDRRFSRAG